MKNGSKEENYSEGNYSSDEIVNLVTESISSNKYLLISKSFSVEIPGIITEANDRICALLGYSIEELRSFSFFDFVDEGDKSFLESKLKRLFQEEKIEYSLNLIDKAGKKHELKCVSLLLASGAEIVELTIAEEPSKSKQKLEGMALGEQREADSSVLEEMGLATLIVNEEYDILKANYEFLKITGYSKDKIKNTNLRNIIRKDLFGTRYDDFNFENGKENGFPKSIHCILIDQLNNHIYVQLFIGKLKQRKEFIVTIVDVTDHTILQNALSKSENKFRELFDTANDMIFLYPLGEDGKRGNFIEVNKIACDKLGYSREELLESNLNSIVHEDYSGQLEEYASGMMKTREELLKGSPVPTEYGKSRFVTSSGDIIHIEYNSSYMQIENEFLILAIVRDITERKELEEKIIRNEIKYRELFNNANDMIFLDTLSEKGEKGKFIEVNRQACEILDYSKEEFLTMTFYDVMSEKFHKNLMEKSVSITKRFDELEEGAIFGGSVQESEFVTKTGNIIPIEFSSTLFRLEQEIAMLTVARDIRDQVAGKKALQRELSINATFAELEALILEPMNTIIMSKLILESAKKLAKSSLGYVSLIDPLIEYNVEHTGTDDLGENQYEVEEGNPIFKEYTELWGWVISNKKAILTNNPHNHPLYTGTPSGNKELKRFLSVPIIYRETVLGQISLANAPEDYLKEDLELIERLADVYAIAIDRKRTEDKIAYQHKFVNTIIESLSYPFVVIDIEDYSIIHANEAAKKLYHKENETNLKCYQLTHNIEKPCQEEGEICPLEEIRKTRKPTNIDHIHYTPDGDKIFVELHASPVFDENEKLIQIIETSIDVTEKRKIMDELQKSENLYRTLFEVSGSANVILSEDRQIKEMNSKAKNLLGYAPEEEIEIDIWKETFSDEEMKRISMYHMMRRKDPKSVPTLFETSFKDRYGKEKNAIVSVDLIPGTKDSVVSFVDITEIREKEQALKESEEKYSTVVESSNDGIIIIQDGKIVYLNSKMTEMVKYTSEELIGETPFAFISEEHRNMVIEYYERRIAGDKTVPERYEIDIISSEGERIPVDINVTLMEYKNKPASVSILRDIRERKKAEKSLKESETKYRRVFNNALDMIHITSRPLETEEIRFIDLNEKSREFYGYGKEEFLKLSIFDLMAEEFHDYIGNLFGKAVDEEITGEIIAKTKDGKKIPVEFSASSFVMDNNLITTTISRDISKRKKAEDSLKESEQRYSIAQKAANIGSWDWNIITNELKWSEQIEPLFGFEEGEFEGTYDAFLKTVHTEDRKFVEDSVNNSVENGKDYDIEHRIVWSDGTIRWVSEKAEVFRDKNRKPIRMIGIVQDITGRKRAELSLIEEKEKLKKYLNVAEVIVVTIDRNQSVVLINQKGCEILGYSEEEIVGKNWFTNFLPENNREEVKTVFNKIIKGEIEPFKEYSNTILTKNGEEIEVLWRNAVFRDENGQIVESVGSGLVVNH